MNRVKWVALVALGAAAMLGCGSHGSSPEESEADAGPRTVHDSGKGGVTSLADSAGGTTLGTTTLTSLSISPPTAQLDLENGMVPTQTFTASGVFSDGSTRALSSGLSWSCNNAPVGAIASSGVYTPAGSVGGQVNVTLTYEGKTTNAVLTVVLHLTNNSAMASASQQMPLELATTPDPTVVWAYPYDGTVFPRGLEGPLLMWNGSVMGDLYYVNVTSGTFVFEDFATADPPSQYTFPAGVWDAFVDSTSGSATLTVARLSGGVATIISQLDWTIAPASLRGTVYYWANNKGRVERIQPGATAPDDFADPGPLTNTTAFPEQSSCLMTCHTVAANGSVLISGGGTFGGSYDLMGNQPMNSLGGVWGFGLPDGGTEDDWQVAQWETAAVSPDGQYVATNQTATQLAVNEGATGTAEGLFKTADGSLVPNSGLEALSPLFPAWSPDGSKIAYVSAMFAPTDSWDAPPIGPLFYVPFNTSATPMAGTPVPLVYPGTDPNSQLIAWPSISPDGRWIIYQRGVSPDTRNGNADLYLADSQNPGAEVRLGALDGDGYPFAADVDGGTRDLSLNYEPTFAPVASGGFFWVVFTSRRTYGNLLTGDKTMVKQLWIAAIDQTSASSENPVDPLAPADPSHAPFLLAEQDHSSLNMRGYFALPPCKSDGMSCSQGTDCCGGYCNALPDDAGAGAGGGGDAGTGLACASMSNGCSQDGDHCSQTSDCCNASTGATCINSVCSEPAPQ